MNMHGRESKLRWRLAALGMALAAGCAAPDPIPATATLAGTHWQLVTVDSMDDGQTTYRVTDPTRYTATFAKDGRVSFRLDCNRAEATWTGGAGSSGPLAFGPVAMTRAACAPPSLDRAISRGLADVHAFRIVQGRLTMSLKVEGGAYTWAPAPPPPTP